MMTFDSGTGGVVESAPPASQAGTRTHVRAVVLDLGGVILATGLRYAALARLMGRGTDDADRDAVKAAVWKHRRDYDLGRPAADYWRDVADELGVQHVDLAALMAVEADRWSHPLPDAVDLLDALEDAPVKVGVLANAPMSLARAFDDQEWAEVIDTARFSARTGVLVPDERMFALVETDLGVDPSEVVFFDNNEEHVAAARSHGWDARIWEGGRPARHVLMDLGVLR